MILFRSLSLAHFKSFRSPVTWKFGPKHGFFFLTGKNQLNPELGRNAAGKTSLLDGLAWTLYGRTARGQKASDIVSWDADGAITEGSVEFVTEDRYYRLTRTQSPNSLTIERKGKAPKTVTQDDIDRIIGLTYPEFLAVVLMGQFNQFFFDLSPADKLQQFSSMLGLDYWSKKATQAADLATQFDRKYVELDKELEGLREKIRVLSEELQIAQKEERELQRKRQDELGVLRKDFELLKRQIEALETTIYNAALKVEQMEKWRTEQQVSISAVEKDLKDHRDQLRSAEIVESKLKFGRDEAEQVLKGSYSDKCPLCNAPVQDRERRVQDATAQVRLARSVWLTADGTARKLRTQVEKLDAGLTELRKQLDQTNQQLSDLKSNHASLLVELKNLQSRKADCRERYRALKAGSGSSPSRGKKIAVSLADSRLALFQRGKLLPFYASRRHGGEYWTKSFRDLRLWLVEEALKQLEVEVSNSLLALGLRDWKVTFGIERITKAGGVSRGFNVFITPAGSDEPIRWESFSGGETQRLRVAGAIGLANLIRDRRGFDCNLEFWDEPTAGLSTEGVDDLLAFFASRSQDERRQIWLIDHRALAYDFDGSVVVTKKSAGSFLHGGLGWSHGNER